MDVEGAEWKSLQNMLRSTVLRRVKQLAMEIHVYHKPNLAKLLEYWTILHQLEERGFRRWHWTINYHGANMYAVSTGSRSTCYEMVYINANFLDKNQN